MVSGVLGLKAKLAGVHVISHGMRCQSVSAEATH